MLYKSEMYNVYVCDYKKEDKWGKTKDQDDVTLLSRPNRKDKYKF